MSATVPTNDEHQALAGQVTALDGQVTTVAGLVTALGERLKALETVPKPTVDVPPVAPPPSPPPVGPPPIYVGLPYTVITQPTDAAVQAGLKAWRANFNGVFPKSRLVFAFSGTAPLTTPLDAALGTKQIQGARWEGLGKRNTVLSWARTDVPLLSAHGLLRNWKFSDLSVKSTAPRDPATGHAAAKGFYLFSDQTRYNGDGVFESVEWMGGWEYGIGLDGPVDANLNSEIVFDRVATSADASFSKAWFWCGMTPGFPQENQFLNYTIRDSKLEYSHGDGIRFDFGGALHTEGFNSWILIGGKSPDGLARGTYVVLRSVGSDSHAIADLRGVRSEHRSAEVMLLDSSWSSSGRIHLPNLNGGAHSFRIPIFEVIRLSNNAALDASGYFPGYIGLHDSANPAIDLWQPIAKGKDASTGVMTPTVTAGPATGPGGIVRTFDKASGAKVRFR